MAHSGGVFGLCWSADGHCIATASGDKTVKVWNVASKELMKFVLSQMMFYLEFCQSLSFEIGNIFTFEIAQLSDCCAVFLEFWPLFELFLLSGENVILDYD